jgi:RimJ/RimL family protein N-acetyltransferase
LVEVRRRDPEAWRTDDDGPAIDERVRTMIERSGQLTNGMLDLGIDVDGRLVGEIQARCPQFGLPRGVFELGIGLFDEADRGGGIGTRAVAMMTTRLFELSGAHRVQISTDVDNAAMRAVAERLGFGFEGVLAGFMPDPRGPRDYAMYGITRDRYEDVIQTWTSTS